MTQLTQYRNTVYYSDTQSCPKRSRHTLFVRGHFSCKLSSSLLSTFKLLLHLKSVTDIHVISPMRNFIHTQRQCIQTTKGYNLESIHYHSCMHTHSMNLDNESRVTHKHTSKCQHVLMLYRRSALSIHADQIKGTLQIVSRKDKCCSPAGCWSLSILGTLSNPSLTLYLLACWYQYLICIIIFKIRIQQ